MDSTVILDDKAGKINLQRKWGKLWPYFFPDNSLHNLYKKHLMFQEYAVCTKKSRLNPREHTLLLRGTLGNRFWRPSSHPSSFPQSVTDVAAKVCTKLDPHTLALTCLSSHHSSFCSMGGSLCPFGNQTPLMGLRQSLYCLNCSLLGKTEDHR